MQKFHIPSYSQSHFGTQHILISLLFLIFVSISLMAPFSTYTLLEDGRLLPLVESFYTIQGEGFHTGEAAFFIRLGGCDVGCSWCDAKETWNPQLFPPVPIERIVEGALECQAKSVVITGGEPMNYPLDRLCAALKENGLKIFLETSGSAPLSGTFDWICLSPKRNAPPREEFFPLADELKVIIEEHTDFIWAEENKEKIIAASKQRASVRGWAEPCYFFLQPEWSRMKMVLPQIIEYVKGNPTWCISLQSHKFMNIP